MQNIINKDINSLISAEYNPRQLKKEQYQNIKESLQRFGFVDPVIVNKNKDRKNIIIGGHQRVKVAKDLKYTEIPCLELDLPLDKEKELNIRLNKNVGEWDYDILANLFDFNDLMDWGFTEDDLAGFAPELEEEGLIDDDDIPEDVEPVCKLGDIWKLGNHRLLCGDSTKKENIELLLDGNKADMVFTDPPYGVDYQSNMRTKSKKFDKIQNDNSFIKEWIPLIDDYSNGFVFIWTSWKVVDVWIDLCKGIGDLSNMIIWDKGGGGIGDLKKTFSTDYELALVYHRNNDLKGKRIGSVWEIGKDKAVDYKHPTQKPVELGVVAINHTSIKNNIVLDLFLGSGSTLIACEKTNRVCYGMELDEHYCDVIINRWEQFTGKKAELING